MGWMQLMVGAIGGAMVFDLCGRDRFGEGGEILFLDDMDMQYMRIVTHANT